MYSYFLAQTRKKDDEKDEIFEKNFLGSKREKTVPIDFFKLISSLITS
jgi:hypothetical protein